MPLGTLEGSVVVVTGGGTGLGRALAIEAAGEGACVVIASIVDASDAVAEVEGVGGKAEWSHVDVSDYAAMVDLADHVQSRYGRINILINNAVASGGAGSLPHADPEAVSRVFAVNIGGYFNGIRAFAGGLIASARRDEPAYILNVGSEHSLGVPPHVPPSSAYTVTKYAVLGITDVCRRDLADTGVSVSLLAPSWILTDVVKSYATRSPELERAIRPWAQTPADVARRALAGLLRKEYLIVTNPKSVPFAKDRAHRILGDLSWAEHREEAAEGWVHDGTGDISKCPVAHTPDLS